MNFKIIVRLQIIDFEFLRFGVNLIYGLSVKIVSTKTAYTDS